MHNLCNRSMLDRYRQIRTYVEDWEADALVIHSIKSCRLFSAGQGDMRGTSPRISESPRSWWSPTWRIRVITPKPR